MAEYEGLKKPFKPNGRGLVENIGRTGRPDRAYNMELFHDVEIREAIIERFEIDNDLDPIAPDFQRWRFLAFHRFLGFDYVRPATIGQEWPFRNVAAKDTAPLSRGLRDYRDEHAGPVTNWDQFERYPWPDPGAPEMTSDLEWWNENLPDDMCLVGMVGGHFCEYLTWLMGYETLCLALYDQRDLVNRPGFSGGSVV